VNVDPSSQSLILPGESPEADRRFERALRLNGTHDSVKSTRVIPPAARRESRRWEELYRMVTQSDKSLPKGSKLDLAR
jgi:hypothetical protein